MRRLTLILAVAVLGIGVLSSCGGSSHASNHPLGKYLGGVVAHHVINHLSPKHQRLANKAFCLYHGRRVLVDLKAHHYGTAGLNAYSAYKSCKAGFGKKK